MSCGGTADGRWLYIAGAMAFRLRARVKVTNPRTGRWCVAQVADIGPNIRLRRARGGQARDRRLARSRELFNADARSGGRQRMLALAEPWRRAPPHSARARRPPPTDTTDTDADADADTRRRR